MLTEISFHTAMAFLNVFEKILLTLTKELFNIHHTIITLYRINIRGIVLFYQIKLGTIGRSETGGYAKLISPCYVLRLQ